MLGLVYVIVGLLLLIQMLLRLAWIDVLLVVSPLAAACWVLPQTQGWAQTWNEQFTGAVFTQLLQVVALKLTGMLLVAVVRLEPDVTWLSFLMGERPPVADLAHTWPDAGRRWRKRRRHAAPRACARSYAQDRRMMESIAGKVLLALG
ncbi:MAG: hypothetical protein JOZ87_01215, partial [Chloroflexi bacterium]|nr:hypothetical protein [Chloroflexota bacterium]